MKCSPGVRTVTQPRSSEYKTVKTRYKTVRAHIRQSRSDAGLGFQVKALKTCYGVPSSLGKGARRTRGFRVRYSSQFENNYFTEMCSGSEAGSYLRLIDFVYHSTLGLRVIKKEDGPA